MRKAVTKAKGSKNITVYTLDVSLPSIYTQQYKIHNCKSERVAPAKEEEEEEKIRKKIIKLLKYNNGTESTANAEDAFHSAYTHTHT